LSDQIVSTPILSIYRNSDWSIFRGPQRSPPVSRTGYQAEQEQWGRFCFGRFLSFSGAWWIV